MPKLPITATSLPLSWGRDGKTLLFLGGDLIGYGADQKPYLLDIESGKLSNLGSNAPWYWNGAALSPDGTKLALLLSLKYPGDEEPERLVVLDPATASFERIVGSRQVAQIDALSWSPDGKQIVFCAYRDDEHGDLYVADVETKRVRKLLGTDAGERQPAWSPDGRWIAFERSVAARPQETSIWIADAKTGAAQPVTWGVADTTPAWSPDGEQIAFVRRAQPPAPVS